MSRTAFEQGNNNVTTHHGNRILKRRNPHGAGMFERSYPQQVDVWNAYYRNTEYASASLTSSGELSTPFIEGRYPTDKERLAVCEKMLTEGFIMADCRDKRNFIVHGKETFPVDFGQVYPSTHKHYGLSLPIVRKEIAQLKKLVESQREDPRFIPIEEQIENLKHYKSTLTGNDELSQNKVRRIDRFILDTQDRIQAFKDGNKHAFDTYVQDNRDSINVLHQNRTTSPIVKTILTILFTGIVPGLLVGAIQWMASKGNSFLFTERQTQSEKRASGIQDNVFEAINGTSLFRKSLEKERRSETEESEADTEKEALNPRN